MNDTGVKACCFEGYHFSYFKYNHMNECLSEFKQEYVSNQGADSLNKAVSITMQGNDVNHDVRVLTLSRATYGYTVLQ